MFLKGNYYVEETRRKSGSGDGGFQGDWCVDCAAPGGRRRERGGELQLEQRRGGSGRWRDQWQRWPGDCCAGECGQGGRCAAGGCGDQARLLATGGGGG